MFKSSQEDGRAGTDFRFVWGVKSLRCHSAERCLYHASLWPESEGIESSDAIQSKERSTMTLPNGFLSVGKMHMIFILYKTGGFQQ